MILFSVRLVPWVRHQRLVLAVSGLALIAKDFDPPGQFLNLSALVVFDNGFMRKNDPLSVGWCRSYTGLV